MSLTRPLSTALLLLASAAAAAQELETPARIAAAAESYVLAQTAPGVKAAAAPLDRRLRLPACGQDLQATAPAANARSAWSVAVHCAAPEAWTIYVPVRVMDRRGVVVLKRALTPGMTVAADDIAVEPREVGSLAYGYIETPEAVIGKTLRKPAMVGAVLPPDAVAPPPSVHRGQDVTLLSRAGGFEVRAAGVALGDAANGGRVRVENQDSHRVVEGQVIDAGTVEVSAE